MYRSAAHIAAVCGLYLSLTMIVPAVIDFQAGYASWEVFMRAGFFGGGLCLATAIATHEPMPPLSKRMGFLLVNLLWITFCLIGALPLWLSQLNLSLAQAIFESVSAVTTTGSTVIVGLDHVAPGLLLWRSMLQWFGGIGIVALGLFVMPFLRVGGISFFRLESSDTNAKPFARIVSFLRALVMIYIALTLFCAIAYRTLGMTQFDAINHAFTTVATGGFSTHDASFGYYDRVGLLWAATFFMTLCSLPFSILILFVVRRRAEALRDPQVAFFLVALATLAMALAVYHRIESGAPFSEALSLAFFSVASILSTTGFASSDYTAWGSFAMVVAFFATFMGGCSGSTAGGMKAYRFVIIINSFLPIVARIIYPNSVLAVRYGNLIVEPDTQRAVFIFFVTYLAIWALGSLFMAALGYDIVTSMSAVITALSNVGPGTGPVVGPAGNFSTISDPALAMLSIVMIMGRLEILTVLVILAPVFWKT